MTRKHDKKKEPGNGKSTVREDIEEELFNDEENLVEESFDEDDY